MKKSPVMKMTICLSDPDEANLILTNMMMLQMIMTVQGMKKKRLMRIFSGFLPRSSSITVQVWVYSFSPIFPYDPDNGASMENTGTVQQRKIVTFLTQQFMMFSALSCNTKMQVLFTVSIIRLRMKAPRQVKKTRGKMWQKAPVCL